MTTLPAAGPQDRGEALVAALVELEHHVAASGWDAPPRLFALVETDALAAAEPDLARIVAYHRRSDVELADAAAAASGPDGVPVLSATELAVASPGNAGVAALRAAGRYCYPTAHRAIRALAHAERHARWRRREGL